MKSFRGVFLPGPLVLGSAAAMLVPAVFAATDVTPEAQAWIDVATVSGMNMGGDPMAMLGAMMGGKGAGQAPTNTFGNTKNMSAGRWVDVTVRSRSQPNLSDAKQTIPSGFMSPALDLRTPVNAPPAPVRDDEEVTHQAPEKPKGRMLLYWGCGAEIRTGQPKILDMATASAGDYGKFFVARSATQRGAHSAVGRPIWPNPQDSRMVPAEASLVGEHSFSGKGIPEKFNFKLPAAQDLMPPLQLDQAEQNGSTQVSWNSIPTARGYFVSAMGSNENSDMVMWTSSEEADTGFGLMDYQTNPAVDRWIKEKILLAPQTTRCSVPKGIFGDKGKSVGMLRMIAYGDELNLLHPPRPADPKAKWEPLWSVKVRVKAVALGMLGMPDMGSDRAARRNNSSTSKKPAGATANQKLETEIEEITVEEIPSKDNPGNTTPSSTSKKEAAPETTQSPLELPKLPQALELLKGVFGR